MRNMKHKHLFSSAFYISLSFSTFAKKASDSTHTDTYLYDIISDPYEETNLYGYSQYDDALSEIEARADYWSTFILDPQLPNKTNMNPTFSLAGGVAPWVMSDFPPLVTEQIYFYNDAPDIIFMFVDDWGYNDVGFRSTYLNWTTPNIDKLAAEGIKLENYYSHETCTPSRGALLTGRYSLRLGLWMQHVEGELPLNETLISEELRTAGYRTYMVGKWHLGYSTPAHLPINRGFDSFYGYYNGYVDYWTKTYADYLDLQDGDKIVSDQHEISSSLHNGYLLQRKAEEAISFHAANHSDSPMFLYYALQLIHGYWSAPEDYLSRCEFPSTLSDDYVGSVEYNYCALNVMLDEAIANLTCALKQYGRSDNTVMFIVSDNGGEGTVSGNSYPFRGHKGSYFRGGITTTAIVHSTSILPEAVRGQSYNGLMHVTDWLPTLMGIATGSTWTGSYTGADLDGYDMWAAILGNLSSPRTEVVHYVDSQNFSILMNDMKYFKGVKDNPADNPDFIFSADQNPGGARFLCSNPADDDQLKLSTLGFLATSSGPVGAATSVVGPLSVAITAFFTFGLLLAVDRCRCRRGAQKGQQSLDPPWGQGFSKLCTDGSIVADRERDTAIHEMDDEIGESTPLCSRNSVEQH